MKNQLLFLTLSTLTFVGCTKTIEIHDPSVAPRNTHAVIYEEPISYNESVYQPPVTYQEVREEPRQEHREIITPTQTREPIVHNRATMANIKPLEASDKLLEGVNVMLLDVRTPQEIKSDGKIANSLLIPLDSLSRNLNRLDKSKKIIVYCHTGNRSLEATKFLRSRGYDAINMLGGIEAWKQNHLNVIWK